MSHDDDKYNSPGSEAVSDAEFDAFLRGDDALARQLAALPQPQPSATLDAAILRHVQADLRRPSASNDAAQRSMVSRWSMPIALAASFVVTFSLVHEWDGYISDAPAEAAAPVVVAPAAPAAPASAAAAAAGLAAETVPAPASAATPQPPPPPAFTAPPSRQAPLRKPAASAQAAPNQPSELSGALVKPSPQQAEIQAEAPRADIDSAAEKSSLPLRRSAAAPMPPPPAPVSVAGSRNMAPRPIETDSSKADGIKADSIKADPWLAVIDEMLKAGLPRDASEEWTRFRLAYPDYPVPPALAERIKAAQR